MARLGNYEIHVISEKPAHRVEITQHPVEEGIEITDHVDKRPTTMQITGMILAPDAANIRESLLNSMNRGEMLTYIGRNAFYNVLIASFDSEHDAQVANGLRFTATLQEIRIAKPSYSSSLEPAMQSQVKEETNQGRQQLQPPLTSPVEHSIRAGETLSAIAPKYGTTWPEIVKLNPGIVPEQLQIGQIVRVI